MEVRGWLAMGLSVLCLLLLLQGRLSIRSTHKLAEVRLAAKEMG